MVKDGSVRVKHFAHQVRCSSPLAMPESPQHLLGKWYIAEHLRAELEPYAVAEIEYEVVIPEAGRVADVLVTFPEGWRVAHECQLASVTTGELQERTEAYGRAGIDVIWWLGRQAATQQNLTWCATTLGIAYQLHFAVQ
jgi:competence CoiA-like predicted nuclease